jgi:SNF family Na+-dependent transporter
MAIERGAWGSRAGFILAAAGSAVGPGNIWGFPTPRCGRSSIATVWNNFAPPLGGLLIALFVGHVWRIDEALRELRADGAWFPAPGLWGFLIRYVCPAAILLILFFTIRDLAG